MEIGKNLSLLITHNVFKGVSGSVISAFGVVFFLKSFGKLCILFFIRRVMFHFHIDPSGF